MNQHSEREATQGEAVASNEQARRLLRRVRIWLGIVTLLWFLLLTPLFSAEDVSPIGFVVLLVSSALLAIPGVVALVNLSGREASSKRGIERAASVGAAGATAWLLLASLSAVIIYVEVADATGAHAAEIEWVRISGTVAIIVAAAGLNLLACRSARRVQALETPAHRKGAGRFVGVGVMAAYFLCVLLCAAVIFPCTIRSNITANELLAVIGLRTIHEAAVAYKDAHKNGYPSSLSVLGPPGEGEQPGCARADLIEQLLARGTRAGYSFEFAPGPVLQEPSAGCPEGVGSFEVVARPIQYGRTGVRSFRVDHHGVIHQTGEDRAATKNDPEIRR
jgi:hypothetical protein